MLGDAAFVEGGADGLHEGVDVFLEEELAVAEDAAGVVDGDMHVLPADRAPYDAGAIGATRIAVLPAAADPVSRASLDPAQLLDVDVDELMTLHEHISGRIENRASRRH